MVVRGAPGEPLLRVAAAAGVAIPTGCRSGSCGTCEVELRVRYGEGAGLEDEDCVARACVTRLPRCAATLTVTALRDDNIWGAS